MARLHPWGAEEIGERLYKDSQKRKAQQESRQRSVANPTLAINERSRALKQVPQNCSNHMLLHCHGVMLYKAMVQRILCLVWSRSEMSAVACMRKGWLRSVNAATFRF